MSTLIRCSEDLQPYIPNVIKDVKGETPLFDKLERFLDQAENWFCIHFCPEELLPLIEPEAMQIVALEAYRLAIPHLDLVLTANGFATVGTQNLSPASKARADRLVGGLLIQRDMCLDDLLPQLAKFPAWRETQQAKWFAATMFPFLNIVTVIGQGKCPHDSMWVQYCMLRAKLIDLEASLANEYFSPELLAALRPKMQSGEGLTDAQLHFCETLKYHILSVMSGGGESGAGRVSANDIDRRLMIDLVNYVRQRPEDFPEWHASNTAGQYNPPVFRNSKISSGYFF